MPTQEETADRGATLAEASEDDEKIDCTRCGACCFSESNRHARVTGDDYERLGEDDAERLVTFLGNHAFMRIVRTQEIGHCIALEIDPNSGRFLCGIYERRPAVCRDLERGGSACQGERYTKLDRSRRALPLL